METEKRPSPKFSGNEEYDRIRMDGREGEEHVKRSYGCMFCKQGFTNAQALGGHMNIHRKDRLKGKGYQRHHHQVPETSSDDKKLEVRDSRINTRMLGGERLRLMGPYAIRSHVHQGMADQNKFVRIPGTSATSPRQKRSFTERNFWVRNSHPPWGTDHGYLDDSLSLHIGSSLSSDHKEPNMEVDLELRLGRDPQFETR